MPPPGPGSVTLPSVPDRSWRQRLAIPALVGAVAVGAAAFVLRGPPALGTARALEPGVYLNDVTLRDGTRLWIYRPTRDVTQRLPLVLIAPAGTPLFHGMGLAAGDRPEHLPYVRAGYCVVAYSLDGPASEQQSDWAFFRSVRAFLDARLGVSNARSALDYAVAHLAIDPARIVSAGHSSAATLSLQVAAADPRIRACIAYAPCVDVPGFVGAEQLDALEEFAPGLTRELTRRSPNALLDRLNVPVFLFGAEDDGVVAYDSVAEFARRLGETNGAVEFSDTPSGGHYDAMIDEGVPRAIEWLDGLR